MIKLVRLQVLTSLHQLRVACVVRCYPVQYTPTRCVLTGCMRAGVQPLHPLTCTVAGNRHLSVTTQCGCLQALHSPVYTPNCTAVQCVISERQLSTGSGQPEPVTDSDLTLRQLERSVAAVVAGEPLVVQQLTKQAFLLKSLTWSPHLANLYQNMLNDLMSRPDQLTSPQWLQLLELFIGLPSTFSPRQRLFEYMLFKKPDMTPRDLTNAVKLFGLRGKLSELAEYMDGLLTTIKHFSDSGSFQQPKDVLELLFFLWKLKKVKTAPDEGLRLKIMRLLLQNLSQLVPNMSPEHVTEAFGLLSMEGRRHKPLLSALSARLIDSPPSNNHLTMIRKSLESCEVLSYRNPTLLDYACEQYEKCELQTLSWRELFLVLRSLRVFKYNHPVCRSICRQLLAKSSTQAPATIGHLLHTMSVLNVPFPSEDSVHETMHMMWLLYARQPDVWLSAVLSTAVLRTMQAEWAESVLQESFISSLEQTPGGLAQYLHQLCLVQAATVCDLPRQQGLAINESLLTEFLQQPASKKKTEAKKKLHGIILSIVPIGYVRQNSVLKIGHSIDFEMLVSKDTEDLRFLPLPPPGEQIPNNSQRLAVQLVEFGETLAFEPYLVGSEVLKKTHLQNAGYSTVHLGVWEVLAKRNQVQHVEYFRQAVTAGMGLTRDQTTDTDSSQAITVGQMPKADLVHVIQKLGKVPNTDTDK